MEAHPGLTLVFLDILMRRSHLYPKGIMGLGPMILFMVFASDTVTGMKVL